MTLRSEGGEPQRRPKNQRSRGLSSSSRTNGRTCSGRAVLLGDADVVLQRRVRDLERVLELVPFEDVVLTARLVARPVLRD